MPEYVYYKPCLTSNKIERRLFKGMTDNGDVIIHDLGSDMYGDHPNCIPKEFVLEENEGRILWIEYKIYKLEKTIDRLENYSHRHLVLGKSIENAVRYD